MINVHFNGDIVRCPDISAIQNRVAERRDVEKRCKYGIHEDNCTTWQNSVRNWMNVKNNAYCGRCLMAGSIFCPQHRDRVDKGRMQKKFAMTSQKYRQMSSSAHYLIKEEAKNWVLFLTLTFPKFKKNVKITDKILNQYFSKFVENLRTNYDCSGYMAVREGGIDCEKRPHYHLIISIPFIRFTVLNDIWCRCIADICERSPNALTSDRKSYRIEKNTGKAIRYICKYLSKTKRDRLVSDSRIVFISSNLLIKHKKIQEMSINEILLDTGKYKGIYIQQTSDYSTCFRITDPESFDRFIENFLYPLFECSDKTANLYSYPLKKPPS